MSTESVLRKILSGDGRMVFITVQKERFMFNLEMLIDSSTYFEAMFSGRFKESAKNEIVLEDVGLDEMSLFHEWTFGFIKNFKLLDQDRLLQLAVFADRFMLEGLRKQIYEDINNLIRIKDAGFACKILQTSIQINDLTLKDVSTNWIKATLYISQNPINCFELDWCTRAVVGFINSLVHSIVVLNIEATSELNKILDGRIQTIIEECISFLEKQIPNDWNMFDIPMYDPKEADTPGLLRHIKQWDKLLQNCDVRLLELKKFVQRTLEEYDMKRD